MICVTLNSFLFLANLWIIALDIRYFQSSLGRQILKILQPNFIHTARYLQMFPRSYFCIKHKTWAFFYCIIKWIYLAQWELQHALSPKRKQPYDQILSWVNPLPSYTHTIPFLPLPTPSPFYIYPHPPLSTFPHTLPFLPFPIPSPFYLSPYPPLSTFPHTLPFLPFPIPSPFYLSPHPPLSTFPPYPPISTFPHTLPSLPYLS